MLTKKQTVNRLFLYLLMLGLTLGLSLQAVAEEKSPNKQNSSSEKLHKEDMNCDLPVAWVLQNVS